MPSHLQATEDSIDWRSDWRLVHLGDAEYDLDDDDETELDPEELEDEDYEDDYDDEDDED